MNGSRRYAIRAALFWDPAMSAGLSIDRLIDELKTLVEDLRGRAAGGDARRVQRGGHARAGLCKDSLHDAGLTIT